MVENKPPKILKKELTDILVEKGIGKYLDYVNQDDFVRQNYFFKTGDYYYIVDKYKAEYNYLGKKSSKKWGGKKWQKNLNLEKAQNLVSSIGT